MKKLIKKFKHNDITFYFSYDYDYDLQTHIPHITARRGLQINDAMDTYNTI